MWNVKDVSDFPRLECLQADSGCHANALLFTPFQHSNFVTAKSWYETVPGTITILPMTTNAKAKFYDTRTGHSTSQNKHPLSIISLFKKHTLVDEVCQRNGHACRRALSSVELTSRATDTKASNYARAATQGRGWAKISLTRYRQKASVEVNSTQPFVVLALRVTSIIYTKHILATASNSSLQFMIINTVVV